jgi:hypothetical protein
MVEVASDRYSGDVFAVAIHYPDAVAGTSLAAG